MNRKKVLIVDDKEQIAKILFANLHKDYECFYMQNPPQAIGDEFLAYLKLNELFKQIPVVMLSSEDSTSERIRLLEEGAEDYIVKPFNPQELKIRIKKILD